MDTRGDWMQTGLYCTMLVIYALYIYLMSSDYENLLETRKYAHKLKYALILVNILAWYLSIKYMGPISRVGATYLIILINCIIIYRSSWIYYLYISSLYFTMMYAFRGFFAGLYAVINDVTIIGTLTRSSHYYLFNILGILVAFLFIRVLRRTFGNRNNMTILFKNKHQMKYLVVYQVLIISYLMFINDGRSLEITFKWFSYLYLSTSAVSIALLYLSLKNVIQMSAQAENERVSTQIMSGLQTKLEFYRSYEEKNEALKKFKHDYVKMIRTVRHLLDTQEYERLEKYLEDMGGALHLSSPEIVQYSNNTLLEAILHDNAERAQSFDIDFNALVSIPDNFALSDMDIVRIFANLIDNAIRACSMYDGERILRITGRKVDSWFRIEVTNTYDGKVAYNESRLKTTKKESEHGYGIVIVEEVVESLGGMMNINPHFQENKFQTAIMIPILKPNKKLSGTES